MPDESQIWLHLVVYWGLRVLEIIENVYLTICSFGGNNFLILRHVTGFVNFALVIDLDVD